MGGLTMTGPSMGRSLVDQVELLRQSVNDAVSSGALTDIGIEEWERIALRHGEATRYRSAGVLFVDLATDFLELQRVLSMRHSSSILRRLTTVTAQMAGLMSLTLIKMDQRAASRNWVRTAKIAANEAGDPAMLSWVCAQDAYGHFYSGDLPEAINVARQAQFIARRVPCVGAALAAALEARAQAALGRDRDAETRAALKRAELVLSHLKGDSLAPSAFGYNEAQFRFHEGNALTHLHDTKPAWAAQKRALALYPTNDYMDRALIQLDRASCRAYDGDVSAAAVHAARTLVDLTDEQRSGLITARTRQIVQEIPSKYRGLPAVLELRDALMLPAQKEADLP